MSENQSVAYTGMLVLPGEDAPRSVILNVNADQDAVSVHFDTPVGEDSPGTDWEGHAVEIVRRLKYTEGLFITKGFPKESVEMTWKFNAGHDDGSLAGVIIAKPNEHRITGEKGFDLSKSQ
jgi:hypothetical protein